jgi:Ca-activated chloride channel family protein
VISVTQFRVQQEQGTPVVALVIDTSMSMDATDVSPSRLVAAQQAAQVFLQQLPSEFEVVLVTFADQPAVQSPATSDHDAVSKALADLPRGKGTVIGDGLSSATDEIQTAQADASGKTPAAIVLLSDGNDTGSKVPPEQAAQASAAAGIPVYTVVLGADTGNGKGANTQLLQQIATTTGGTMSTAASSGELSSVYESLGSQLSSQLEVSSSAQLFLFIAIALGIAAALITIVLALRTRQY